METASTSPRQAEMERRPASREDRMPPRIWGITVPEVWGKYLAERQISLAVVGTKDDLTDAPVYLLCDPKHVMDADWAKGLELFRKSGKEFAWIRLRQDPQLGYRERHVVDPQSGRLRRIQRIYNSPRARRYRLALTRSAEIAAQWQAASSPQEFASTYLPKATASRRSVVRVEGIPFDLGIDADVTRFMIGLIRAWKNPGLSIEGVKRLRDGVFGPDVEAVSPGARVVGRVWVGADRVVDETECVVGPAVLWDRSTATTRKPSRSAEGWPTPASPFRRVRPLARKTRKPVYEFCKRAFDIVFASVALALTLPFYPIIALLIYLEDGFPIFFGHARETKGGGSFACLKFRSMRRDAEEVRRRILAQNMCDGPQFFIDRDPRLTRVGKILRDLQVDEWPQFLHVLTGKMSVVGPRPLPKPENQYCPAWREMRLSVRPGITGLWQIKRKRLPGLDFQEWIRYDIEYVENRSMRMDLSIILHSVGMLFRLGWAVITGNRSRRPGLAAADSRSAA